MLYSIRIIKNESELSDCPELKVDNFCWGGDYRPVVTAKLAYVDKEGFLLKMHCEEKNPVADYESYQDPVYKDSAMEAFFDFDPEVGKIHYSNFEMNSKGAYLNHFGGLRGHRSPIDDFTDKRPTVISTVTDTYWELTLKIPCDFIGDVFGKKDFEIGDVIRFNCFKTRDVSDERCPAHFASFAPIESEKPDFHRPEFFAEGILC